MWSVIAGSLALTRTAPCRGSGGCAAIELADTYGENMTLEPPKDFDDLRRTSARIGADPLLIQAAGGNTSVKQSRKRQGPCDAGTQPGALLTPVGRDYVGENLWRRK